MEHPRVCKDVDLLQAAFISIYSRFTGIGTSVSNMLPEGIALVPDRAGRVASYPCEPHEGTGVAGARRSPALPDAPTVWEAGIAGYDASTWCAMLAPARTPLEVAGKHNSEVVRILKHKDVGSRGQNSPPSA